MMDDLLRVLGLVLIIEALLPFISPRTYRKAVAQLALTPDARMRSIALAMLLIGLALWVWG
ncbi:MAG: DUF2065 domain-containing protein [Guyparkeria sp.]|uniref:DUF2065 domain-containing protein n=1 Tax=Guyparkeria sp. TaxID=2035736 RepID=UPI00397BDA18